MHKLIEHYLEVHTFDSDTRYGGVVNEGKNLLKFLETHSEDEVLESIDIFRIVASHGYVSIDKKETGTFLNVGKFSFYYHRNCYESDAHWVAEENLNMPYKMMLYDGQARGLLYILSSVPEDDKKRIIERAKNEVIYKCREKFGRW